MAAALIGDPKPLASFDWHIMVDGQTNHTASLFNRAINICLSCFCQRRCLNDSCSPFHIMTSFPADSLPYSFNSSFHPSSLSVRYIFSGVQLGRYGFDAVRIISGVVISSSFGDLVVTSCFVFGRRWTQETLPRRTIQPLRR